MKTMILFATVLLCATLSCMAQPSTEKIYTLAQLQDSALANNESLRAAHYEVEAAKQQRREAFTKYFPNVSATGFAFRSNKPLVDVEVSLADQISPEMGAALASSLPTELVASLADPMNISMMKNGVVGSLTVVQPLFAGGQIVNGNKLAAVGESVSQIQAEMTTRDVERDVENLYYQLVSLSEKVLTLSAVDSLLSATASDVDVAVRAGVALPNDALQVALRRNDIRAQSLQLNNAIRTVRTTLAVRCGLTDDNFSVEKGNELASRKPLMTNHETAVVNTLEMRLLDKATEAAELQRRMDIGAAMPSVAVGAGLNYHNLMGDGTNFGMIFATVSIPITDWWSSSHASKRGKANVRKAETKRGETARLLRIQMDRAADEATEKSELVDIARESVEQATENLRLCRNRYTAGTATMSQLLEAQLLCQQARDKQTDAWTEMMKAQDEYDRLTINSYCK